MSDKLSALIVGCGYLGKALASQLISDGLTVYTLSRSQPPIAQCHNIKMDLAHIDGGLLPDVDIIFYMVSPNSRTETCYVNTFDIYLKNLIQAYSNRSVSRFIFVSSTAVYAASHGEWVTEESELTRSHFRADKLLVGEELAMNFSRSPVVARCSGLYGPNRHPLLDQIRSKNLYMANSRLFSNRIYLDDCASALEHLMRLQFNEGIYNVSDQEPTPINTVMSWLGAKCGVNFPDASESTTEDKANVTNRRISCERLLTTGFTHRYPSFREGFNRVFKTESMQRPLDY